MPKNTSTEEGYIDAPVNIALFRNLFDRVEDQQKQIHVSKNLTLDLTKIINHYDDTNDDHVEFFKYIVNHCSIYRDLLRTGDLSEEAIIKYTQYAKDNGLFFRGPIIDYIHEALASSEFMPLIKTLEIVPPTSDAEALMIEFTVSSQLTNYNLTQYNTLVIGCAHGLHDRSTINHNHSCEHNHDSRSFIVDFNGYGFNGEIIGFDGVNIEHWHFLRQHLNGHRFNNILDHTVALFDTELSYTGLSHDDKQKALKEVALFSREHVLKEGGTIDYLGQDGANHPISDYYFE